MGFWESVGNGMRAAGEWARQEQEKRQRKYDNYSRYSDEHLYNMIEGKYDDNFIRPSDSDKKIALNVLQDRYRR